MKHDPEAIIELAHNFKKYWHTNNPYEIAERMGIIVIHRQVAMTDFTAQTVKVEGYPAIISINDAYTDFSKKLLCAHELGHALLHQESINHFASTSANLKTNVEQEANMFAIALIGEDNIDSRMNMPLKKMNNYLLKTIMDYNLQKKTE